MDAGRGYAIVRAGERGRRRWLVGRRAAEVVLARGDDVFGALDAMASGGLWVGFVSYDAGRAVEHVTARAADDLALPDLAFARFDDVEELDALPDACAPRPPVALGPAASSLDRAGHAGALAAVRELLAAGECYQVNLTRRLTFGAAPDPLALFAAVARANPAPYAGVCTFGASLPGVAVVSASPECYLHLGGRTVETRPVKGTARTASALRASAKDRAENLIIVDLARNDLGRVCEYGSVRVPALFEVESHPGLAHLVSTVRGELRDGVGLGGLVRATFPPASVTGAPKPRVLQAIEDLEPVRRGVYCGAFGYVDGRGAQPRARLAVAIRTFTIAGGRTHLGVGGGIVADSDARAEWDETTLKAARLLAAAGACAPEPEAGTVEPVPAW